MENQINAGSPNGQQVNQGKISQTKQTPEQPKTSYLFLGSVILICFLIFGIGGYYLGSRSVSQNAQPTAIPPTPTIYTNSKLKTYKNAPYGFAFNYPQNYIISPNQDCSLLTHNQAACLLSMTLSPTNSDYPPKAHFYLLKGVESVNIGGQLGGIMFDSQKKAWVLTLPDPSHPQKVLPIWGNTESGLEIIKASNGGSHGTSYYYLIPNYENDKVAIFSVPKSYRLRCDFFTNDKLKETDCHKFYKSIIDQYNGGETIPDTWLPENYLNFLYKDAENIVKSYTETTK